MLEEIINTYGNFPDALILEITYRVIETERVVDITLYGMNFLNDYQYEKIKITFSDILSFNFSEKANESSTAIFSAFLGVDKGVIVFDFFPLIYEGGIFKENEKSDLKIKCTSVHYSKI